MTIRKKLYEEGDKRIFVFIVFILGLLIYAGFSENTLSGGVISETEDQQTALTDKVFLTKINEEGKLETLTLDSGQKPIVVGPDGQLLPEFYGYIVELTEESTYKHLADLQATEIEQTTSEIQKQTTSELFGFKIGSITGGFSGIPSTDLLNEYNSQKQKVLDQQSSFIQKASQLDPNFKVINAHNKLVNAVTIEASTKTIEELRKLPEVKRITPNYKVEALLQESVPLINADDVWNLGYTGQGIKIAVIDTGIDKTHPDLLNKVIKENDFVVGSDPYCGDGDDDSIALDDHGHGTHVAATAAGNGVLKGVAPDANLYAVKVLGTSGCGYDDWIISGIGWAVDPDNDPLTNDGSDIISLSLGGPGDPDDPMSIAIDNAVNAGVVATVAAGNSGPSEFTIGSPGTARKAITVGASDKSDVLASFSSRGPTKVGTVKPDVLAPGVSICAAQWDNWLEGIAECTLELAQHIAISGTSMATPHVAGATALLKQAHPTWTPDEIKYALRNTAKDLGYNPLEQGHGRIDLLKSVQLNSPIIAKLNPINTNYLSGRGIYSFSIEAKTSKAIIKGYEVFLIDLKTADKKSLFKRYYPQPITSITDSIDINTNLEKDSEYLLKLEVIPTNEIQYSKANDYFYFIVDNLGFTNPIDGDLIKPKTNIEIYGYVVAGVKAIEYRALGSVEWQGKKITLTGNSDGLLAYWDGSNLFDGKYELRIVDKNDREEKIIVTLEPKLRDGWPKRIPWPYEELTTKHTWVGYVPTTTFDIDKDGEKEIIVPASRMHDWGDIPSKIYLYNSDGTDLPGWPISLDNYYISTGPVTIADLDLDYDYEILTIGSYYYQSSNPEVQLLIFNSDGTFYKNPVRVYTGRPSSNPFYMPPVVADLDRDEKPEIIVWGGTEIYAFDNQGNKLPGWPVYIGVGGWISIFPLVNSVPAIGNFDNDEDLEIVLAQTLGFNPKTDVYIIDIDGNARKLPALTNDIVFANGYSPAVGDVDNDGRDEIVLAMRKDGTYNGFIFIIESDGTIIGRVDNIYPESSPALADVDGDGDLEIILGFMEDNYYKIGVWNHDGSLVNKWVRDYRSALYSLTSANIDNDNPPEIIAGFYSISRRPIGKYIGGYKKNGIQLQGFPLFSEGTPTASIVIDDLDNDKKIELVASSHDNAKENLKGKYRSSVYVFDLEYENVGFRPEWPMMHHDVQRTGRYDKKITVTPKVSSDINYKELELCTDTDDHGPPLYGHNYYEKGTATDAYVTYTDFCRDQLNLQEYYCENNLVKSEVHRCGDFVPEVCDAKLDACRRI